MGKASRRKSERRRDRLLQAFARAYDLCAALEPGENVELSTLEELALRRALYGR